MLYVPVIILHLILPANRNTARRGTPENASGSSGACATAEASRAEASDVEGATVGEGSTVESSTVEVIGAAECATDSSSAQGPAFERAGIGEDSVFEGSTSSQGVPIASSESELSEVVMDVEVVDRAAGVGGAVEGGSDNVVASSNTETLEAGGAAECEWQERSYISAPVPGHLGSSEDADR